ncbi:uncharacterized protein LACBIDRAFT_304567 [Laccaria bicolor S238N-H82]|uniref:Predicted protein n=1 Tax=Laccaria bicolor (strain S238N-H82 / ATCC MYA-4686) TaxID=486041 RepID=B0DLX1_LACBS|nr:uncharacterized protein LACBIDRAFT_304567 [Laccaria bicolor S238N-H82]EDR04470.1 predicted protein [Laccaria bicolor S238N-H82]|eukprot:XP_001884989.1 predicted protein [Laccaria bicolor S238N-H82]
MAPMGKSATVEGYKAERSGSVSGQSTPSSSPPSMSPSTSPPSCAHSRQPSGGTEAIASSSSRRAHAPSVSAPPPDPSSFSPTQPGQDTHGMTPSIIPHSPPATTTKSRPIEKKVSASARDLRLGLTMTPTPLVTPTTRSRAQNTSPEHEPSHHRDFFTASRRCSKCREVVKSPRSSPNEPFSPRLLHLPCASCNTNHCRGCFKPTRCPPTCSGGQSCPVRTCCSAICAIALFEVLCSFDKEYAGEFIIVVIARTDKRTRAFEGVLVGTLRNVSSWLVQAASASESSSGSGIHASIPRLFTVSHLPSVMHAFLSHTLGAERDWVVHSEVYIALMDVIKNLSSSSNGGVSGVMKEGRSLGDAVKRLERHRQGLERYGNKFKFAAMAEKIEMLCEGISYLLFQQLVGG